MKVATGEPVRWFLFRRVWFGYGESSTRTLVSTLGNEGSRANIRFTDNTDLQTLSVGGKRDETDKKDTSVIEIIGGLAGL